MASVFSKIVKGEIPCYKVAEDDNHLAFLDISPLAEGHTLVIPKMEVDYIYDLDDLALANLHLFAKKVALSIKKSIKCRRVGVAVIGLEVPHAHIHLVPLNQMNDLNFQNPKLQLSQQRLQEIATLIASSF